MTRALIGTMLLGGIVTAALMRSLDAWEAQWMASDLAARDFVLSPWLYLAVFLFMAAIAIGVAALIFVGGSNDR